MSRHPNRWIRNMIEQIQYEMYDYGDWFWLKDSAKKEDYETFDFYYDRIMRSLDSTLENIRDMQQITFAGERH
jgi:hypothetical protein